MDELCFDQASSAAKSIEKSTFCGSDRRPFEWDAPSADRHHGILVRSAAETASGFGLREELEASGRWLFRRRGYLPLLLLPALFFALREFDYPRGSHQLDVVWELICLSVGLLGLGVRIATVGFVPEGTSSRDTTTPTATVLNTTGIYSLVRHPLYLGNFLMWLAPTLLPRSLALLVFVALAFWLYYERIMLAEEEFLRRTFGEAFEEWARRTPTFLPNLRRWQRPALRFSWRTVLRREYSGFFALIATLTTVELAAEYARAGALHLDMYWRILFLASVITYAVLRLLKRRTRALHVRGR